MLTMVTVPDISQVVTDSSVISKPMFGEFTWVIVLSFTVICAIFIINFVKHFIGEQISKFFHNRHHDAREDIIEYIKQNKQLERDVALYREAQKYGWDR